MIRRLPSLDRRRLMALSVAAAAAGMPHGSQAGEGRIRAVAFDAFPIFDPRAAFAAIAEAAPNHADQLREAFFDKVFAYTWLRTAAGRYEEFSRIMDDALLYAAASLKLELSPKARGRVVDVFFALPLWPDAKSVLERLRGRGLRLAFLSNMSEAMLRSNMRLNGIEHLFDHVLSTDRAQVFKPHPAAYRLGPEAFGLPKEKIAFAASAAWDAAGASWFGFPTVWVNRLGAPGEVLDVTPTATGADLRALLRVVAR